MVRDAGLTVTKNSESPFAVLATLPFAEKPSPPERPESEAAGPSRRGPARAVVRLERKHRRGKEVTIVEKLGLSPIDLETWCRDLKRTLGCGGTVETAADGTGAIVLQGDFRPRLEALLVKLGVQKVTISG